MNTLFLSSDLGLSRYKIPENLSPFPLEFSIYQLFDHNFGTLFLQEMFCS